MKFILPVVLLTFLAGCAGDGTMATWPPAGWDRGGEGDNQAWVDEKNHYHPEWRYGINTPAQYPREIPDRPSVGEYMGME